MSTLGAVSPASSNTTMASASTVSPASFHNLTNHVILSPSRGEDVNLTLSPSSSFLSNFSSICTGASKNNSSPPNNNNNNNNNNTFATSTSTFVVYNSDTKENSSCSVNNSMGQPTTTTEPVASTNIRPENVSCTSTAAEATAAEQTESTPTAETNANDISMMSIEEKATTSANAILTTDCLDECSSNSCSTQSSDATSGSGSVRKKRRRGEEQMLMDHLSALDKTLAHGITNQLKPTGSQSPNSQDSKAAALNGCSSQPGEEKSKEDSPAFHLRPRRSFKSGYCSSGSSSPIFLSPVKRNKQPLIKKSIICYTNQLLTDTSQQLSHFVNDQKDVHSGHNSEHTAVSTNCHPLLIKDTTTLLKATESKPRVRSYSASIVRDVDVSVFAELITPRELKYNSCYSGNYIAMQVMDIKPLRYVQISHLNKGSVSSPLLELKTSDINDRFSLSHAKGVFDDTSVSQASTKSLSIYLLGTYAVKASEIAAAGQIVHIVKFRTTKLIKNNNQAVQPPKKRKQMTSPTKRGELVEDDTSDHFPYHVIVDALDDIGDNIKKEVVEVKKEEEDKPALVETLKETTSDNPKTPLGESQENGGGSPTFEALFHSSPRPAEACASNWIPFVSFSSKWQAPKDPKELNQSLYVLQPCIPKFESASRTVKMNN